MRYFLTLLFYVLTVLPAYSIDMNVVLAARSEALGGAGLGLTDLSSIQQNCAIFGRIKEPSCTFTCQNKFLIPGLSLGSLALVFPTNKLGNFGGVVNHYGTGVFGQTKVGLGFARSFGPSFFAGLQLNYLSTEIGDIYGNSHAFTIEAGIQYKLNDFCTAGAQVFNPGHTLVSPVVSEHLPAGLKVGLAFSFSEKLLFVMDLEKQIDLKPLIKGGVEYQPIKIFRLRMGVRNQLSSGAGPVYPVLGFGFGLKIKNCVMDVATTWHSALGSSPSLTFSYAFK